MFSLVSLLTRSEPKGEIKMPENKDQPPILRVEMPDGSAYYPRFKKDTNGNWYLLDAEYWQKMIALQDSRRKTKKG